MNDRTQSRAPALSHMLTLTTLVGVTFAVLRAKGALSEKEIETILNGTQRVLPEVDRDHANEVIEHVRRVTARLAPSAPD